MIAKPFFHELSQSEIDVLIANKSTWPDIMDKYSQPSWCNYPEALSGVMGCWSLTDLSEKSLRKSISKEWCKSCPECKAVL